MALFYTMMENKSSLHYCVKIMSGCCKTRLYHCITSNIPSRRSLNREYYLPPLLHASTGKNRRGTHVLMHGIVNVGVLTNTDRLNEVNRKEQAFCAGRRATVT